MLLERLYDETLSQASYLVACDSTHVGIIVDPNRNIDRYVDAAARRNIRIAYVTETHIHADFVSGARDLAKATGAQQLLSGAGTPDWQYGSATADGARLLDDGDSFDVGHVRLTAYHTPGHTPEHLSFLVTDVSTSAAPVGLLSGDFIFVSDVGRPDLLERAANERGSMERLARQLFHSVHRTSEWPAHLQLWPGHGAGSACGKSLGELPSTTLGYERLSNWAFQISNEEEFVRAALSDQPEPPRYFARMKAVNRDGPPPPDRSELHELTVAEVRAALAAGRPVIDVRPTARFAAGHIPGAINLPLGTSFTTWAGSLLPYDEPIVILANDAGMVSRARALLALVGLDRIHGYAGSKVQEEWAEQVGPLQSVEQVDVKALAADGAHTIVDVRGASEWRDGHIPGARHLFLGDLVALTRDLPRDAPLALQCQGGTRSAIATSLLQAQGFSRVVNVTGGFTAWREAGLPWTTGD